LGPGNKGGREPSSAHNLEGYTSFVDASLS
jgi:hypothetical protein